LHLYASSLQRFLYPRVYAAATAPEHEENWDEREEYGDLLQKMLLPAEPDLIFVIPGFNIPRTAFY
jgi:hypothetical protein